MLGITIRLYAIAVRPFAFSYDLLLFDQLFYILMAFSRMEDFLSIYYLSTILKNIGKDNPFSDQCPLPVCIQTRKKVSPSFLVSIIEIECVFPNT